MLRFVAGDASEGVACFWVARDGQLLARDEGAAGCAIGSARKNDTIYPDRE